MDISLLISGNLTGFGRFYTSPAAKELLENEKLSLDNHDYIFFLNEGEQAYSITFCKKFIAISLYSQILDSFRRPGKLVISLLLPRDYTIVDNNGMPQGATHSLLTRVNEKFYEMNFQDGMINQNLSVLRQDYYSDILAEYTLQPVDRNFINISPATIVKAGYVKAVESQMSKYLDTPYRKNYEGYNLIFFAPSVPDGTPNTIDEEPEEVILYKVRIKNTGNYLPQPVRLSSPVYKLAAMPGEKQFNADGTYQNVIDGLFKPRITGRIVPNETIEIEYNYEKESRMVKFVFVDKDTNGILPFSDIMPSVELPDGIIRISSETFLFQGSEIYERKKLVSGNKNFTICQLSENLDLSRLPEGQDCMVYVQRGVSILIRFNSPFEKPKQVYFINREDGKRLSFDDITFFKEIQLYGKITDWDWGVISDDYSTPIQQVTLANGELDVSRLRKKTKQNPSNNNVNDQKQEPNNEGFDILPSKPGSAVQRKKPEFAQVTLTDEDNSQHNNKPKNKLNKRKIAIVILACIVICALGYVAYRVLNGDNKPNEPKEPDKKETVEHIRGNKLRFEYYDGNQLKENQYYIIKLYDNDELFSENKDYSVNCSNDECIIKFNNSSINKYVVKMFFKHREKEFDREKEFEIAKESVEIDEKSKTEDLNTITIKLNVTKEQLSYFEELEKAEFNDINEKNVWENKINNIKNEEVKNELLNLLKSKNVRNDSRTPKPDADDDGNKQGEDLSKLDDPSFPFSEIENYRRYNGQKLKDGTKVKNRLDALTTCSNYLNGRARDYDGVIAKPSTNYLSKEQAELIKKAKDFRHQLGENESFSSIQDFYNKHHKD